MKRIFGVLVASLSISASVARFGKGKEKLFTECHPHADGHCWHCHVPCDQGDVFLQWNCLALEANVLDHNGRDLSGMDLSLTQGPPASARALAMIHLAMFDAYNLLTGLRYETNLPDLEERMDIPMELARRELHRRFKKKEIASPLVQVAVASAAHTVMTHLYANSTEVLDMIDAALVRTMADQESSGDSSDADESLLEMGQYMGVQVGNLCMEDRQNDGYAREDPYFRQITYTPTGMAGNHDVDPNNPQQGFFSPGVGGMTPLGTAMLEIENFRAPLPPGLQEEADTSSVSAQEDAPMYVLDQFNEEYLRNLEEVKKLGIMRGGTSISDALPLDDTGYVIGNYWSYNGSPCTGTPPRLYNIYARQIAIEKKNSLDENALLFTMLNVGLGNAGISSWDTKYHYQLWRPIMGIRNHPYAAVRDESWSPLGASRSNPYQFEKNFSPPFPAYTSGHATFGAVAFKTLINFYGKDHIDVEFVSDEWNGLTKDMYGRVRPLMPRTFETLTMAMAENSASRVFNGVHWRFDGSAGVQTGIDIADYIFENLFLPVEEASKSKSSRRGPSTLKVRGKSKSLSGGPNTSKFRGQTRDLKFKKFEELKTRKSTPAGDFKAAIDCILANPDYQETGACHYKCK
eukprot:scaffold14782_cov174-Amphora_coffeaeformis.AAC.7